MRQEKSNEERMNGKHGEIWRCEKQAGMRKNDSQEKDKTVSDEIQSEE
jgi:hypothetical protein